MAGRHIKGKSQQSPLPTTPAVSDSPPATRREQQHASRPLLDPTLPNGVATSLSRCTCTSTPFLTSASRTLEISNSLIKPPESASWKPCSSRKRKKKEEERHANYPAAFSSFSTAIRQIHNKPPLSTSYTPTNEKLVQNEELKKTAV